MARLKEMWARFSLSEEEEHGAEVSQQRALIIHRLVGKFLTKRVLNVDVMARTFKLLWKPIGELKIRDVGDNILLFEFKDILDLERVLEFEPWSYDKHLVIFQKAIDAESAPLLDYSFTTFWMQIHNIPPDLVTQETSESIGSTLGSGAGSRPGGQQNKGVDHGDRECEVWLRSMGQLRREDQQYGDWLRVDTFQATRKTVVVISSMARNQAPWLKQKQRRAQDHGAMGGMSSQSNSRTSLGFDKQRGCNSAKHVVVSKPVTPTNDEAGRGCTSDSESMATSDCRVCLELQAARLEKNISNLYIDESTGYQAPMDKLAATGSHGLNVEYPKPLDDDSAISKPTPQSTRGWKRLAREVGNIDQGTKVCSGPESEGEKMTLGSMVCAWR
nr:hypothetical protein CFP56_43432 [Quercus suber]